ncbi:hypothetical protein ACLBWX_10190 [Methylobacterium sp. M6A4_1b]|uniref:hypothetical protein n=1 Tax=Methylobacterium TaxID=407 RepID=UPI000ABB3872|nr:MULTISPECIES: hypothetical protein [Methylobacterium]MCI9882890.1 hypothetical protein [Methylobacterium goesingense]
MSQYLRHLRAMASDRLNALRFGNQRHDPRPSDLLKQFESFGDNCEFGLVQRYCGAEPLGLLRFVFSDLDKLIHGLDTDFQDYGQSGDLELHTGSDDVTYCRSRHFGFPYIVHRTGSDEGPDKIIRREYKKVAYLKRRLLEDLASGNKIVVRKGDPANTGQARERLIRALRRHGRTTLLHVTASEAEVTPGHVEWEGDGLLHGVVRRFAPYERAADLDLRSWLLICTNADRLIRGLEPVSALPKPPNLLPWRHRRARVHRGGSGASVPGNAQVGLEVFGYQHAVGTFDREEVYVLSAWIWIPIGFEGSEVRPAIGHLRLSWRYADLLIRDAWQFVWVSALIPKPFDKIFVGLVVVGAGEEGVRSVNWRFEMSPAPFMSDAPAILRNSDRECA